MSDEILHFPEGNNIVEVPVPPPTHVPPVTIKWSFVTPLTEERLREIIREEVRCLLEEAFPNPDEAVEKLSQEMQNPNTGGWVRWL